MVTTFGSNGASAELRSNRGTEFVRFEEQGVSDGGTQLFRVTFEYAGFVHVDSEDDSDLTTIQRTEIQYVPINASFWKDLVKSLVEWQQTGAHFQHTIEGSHRLRVRLHVPGGIIASDEKPTVDLEIEAGHNLSRMLLVVDQSCLRVFEEDIRSYLGD